MGCAPSTHKPISTEDQPQQNLIESSGEARADLPKAGRGGLCRTCGLGGGTCRMWGRCVAATCCSNPQRAQALSATDNKVAHTVLDSSPHHNSVAAPGLQSSLKVLLVVAKDDITTAVLSNCVDVLGCSKDVVRSVEEALDAVRTVSHHLVIVDMRRGSGRGEQLCRSLRCLQRTSHVVLVAVCRRGTVEKDGRELRTILDMGFNRVMVEPLSAPQCLLELTQLRHQQLALESSLAKHLAVCAALDRSRDLVFITDIHHVLQYSNKTSCQVLGYATNDLMGVSLPSLHQLGSMDQVVRHLEKGLSWDGKISWRCKSGECVSLQCRAAPFLAGAKEPTHFVYIQDNPQDHNYPRGSVPSIRKGSYDLKSINSEGAQSARRQSLAKLHNLPLEAPITRVISLICAAQENSTGQVVQVLDKVVDILRTTELYSSHLKTDNLRCEDPVTSDLIGALITQGPVPVSTTRRSSNDSAAVKGQASLAPGAKATFTLHVSPHLKELLDTSLLWEFNIFKLEELTGKRPLVYIGMNLLVHFDVHKTLGCDERTLHNWLSVVERHYHAANAYHNSTHAADVLQATAGFLERERIKRLLDELDEACCLIAAAAHDIDHPGKSSAFLCNSGNVLALLYNDISVLESHHAALTFKLTLRDDRVNIFKGLERDTYKVARQSVIDMILATEMTKHFEHLAKFVSVFNRPTITSEESNSSDMKSPSDGGGDFILTTSADEVNLVKRMMIKCADVSNPTRPLKMCVEWARRIAEEYFTQTDEEKANHLPVVMPMFDRTSCSIPKSQMGFVDFIINDMFEAWDAFIDMPEMLYHLRSNYQYWKELEEKGVTSLGDISLKQMSLSVSPNTNLPNIPEKNA